MASPNARTHNRADRAAEFPDQAGPAPLERRGRRWIFGSFALCPCHVPLTLGILVTVFGGTAVGAVLGDHVVIAGAVITVAWVAGTWRGFRLVRLGQQGACPLSAQAAGPAASQNMTFGSAQADGWQVAMTTDEKTGRSQR